MKIKKRNIYEFVFCFLAIVSVILAIMDMIGGLTSILSFIDYAIWIVFVLDYIIRLILSRKKLEFMKSNILDFIAILPFNSAFRAFRALKVLKVLKMTKLSKTIRLFAILGRFTHKFKRFINTNGFKYMLLIAALFSLIGGALISVLENITFFDGIWWAFVTTTTVGYGDISPTSAGGRIVACILMIVGIGLVGSLTSTITSYFIREPQENISGVNDDKVKMALILYNQLSAEEKAVFMNTITK